jgi:hypothetical protein
MTTGQVADCEELQRFEMRASLTRFAHKLPHPLLLRAFLMKYALADLRMERKARRQNKLIPLSELNLSKFKKSDTVFMLGSGPSINAISQRRWAAIARHDSIGCNFWLFHSFVPTFYFYEAIGYRSGKVFEAFQRIAEKRANEYANCVKVVTGLMGLTPHFDLFRPEAWAKDLHTTYTVPVPARSEQEFEVGLRLLRKFGIFSRTAKVSKIFKQGSSITGLISLAVRMGYTKIVLCGVDLGNAEYFYQDSNLYPEAAQVELQSRQASHILMTPHRWKVLTDKAVEIMTREILEPAGVKIYVENPSSRLWPAIPEAPELLFE